VIGSATIDDVTHLYKYRSLSGESFRFVERLLLHNELYFSRPTEFNDPLDCCPVPSLRVTEDEFAKYLNDLYKRQMPELSSTDRRRSVRAILNDPMRNHRSGAAVGAFRTAMNDAVNSAGVLALSARPDHILMWSHYADSHRGICLRFQASSTTPFFGRAQRVLYQVERPVLNLIHDSPGHQSEKALLTKADFWSYEEEWRIVEHEAGPGVHKFPSELLDGVILGARISQGNRESILSWLRQRPTPTEIFQAQIDPAKFRLQIAALSNA
jgi:hypothetical protein